MNMTKLYPIPTFIVSAMLLFLGIFVYRNSKQQYINKVFMGLCFTSSCWLLFFSITYTVRNEYIAFMLEKIGYCGITFIPITVFHYIIEFLNIKRIKRFALYNYIVGLIFVVLIWTTPFIVGGVKNYFWGYYPVAGILHPLFLAYFIFIGVILSSLFLLFKYYYRQKQLTYLKKEQIKYVILAFFIYYFAAADFFPNYGISIYPFGYLPTLFFIIIISYTIVRFRLMDVNVAITRAGIFLVLYSLVLGIPFLIGHYTESWILSTIFAVILASIGPLVYRSIQRKAEDLLLAEQRRYQKILVQAASGMAGEHNLERLLKLIVRVVKKAVKMEYTAIFLEDREKEAYILRAIRTDTNIPIDISFGFKDPLIEFMKKHKEPFLFEEIPEFIKGTLNFPLNISLIVPSFFDESSIGFLVLGEKNNKKAYSTDDINVFKILSRRTSMSIENCIFVEEFKKAQERVFAAEKLASIGGLAEGVAHQINNRLNHFSMVSGELKYEVDSYLSAHAEAIVQNPDLKKTFDYFIKISNSLLSNVKRTDGILKGILNFARVEAKETLFSNFFLQEVVDLAIDLLRVKHSVQEFPIKVNKLSSDVIYGVKSQIMESVYNLIDNAYEATLDKANTLNPGDAALYKPNIEISISQNPEKTVIQFTDNGIGIKSTDRHKIFAPFFTTKSSSKSGTGIGMYVVRRMIEENHKGKIWFESEYGKGTKITIELPKKYTSGSN